MKKLTFFLLILFSFTAFAQFTVDSENSFDMGEAAGQFAYVETKDQTLIELVETHKVPIMKKFGWYINLKNKKVQKPLPRFIFKVLGKIG